MADVVQREVPGGPWPGRGGSCSRLHRCAQAERSYTKRCILPQHNQASALLLSQRYQAQGASPSANQGRRANTMMTGGRTRLLDLPLAPCRRTACWHSEKVFRMYQRRLQDGIAFHFLHHLRVHGLCGHHAWPWHGCRGRTMDSGAPRARQSLTSIDAFVEFVTRMFCIRRGSIGQWHGLGEGS